MEIQSSNQMTDSQALPLLGENGLLKFSVERCPSAHCLNWQIAAAMDSSLPPCAALCRRDFPAKR